MQDRRKFITSIGALSLGTGLLPKNLDFRLDTSNLKPEWKKIRAQFPIADNELLHLNSGSAGVMPDPVLKKYVELVTYINAHPPYKVWDKWTEEKQKNKNRLAEIIGCAPEEINVMRNTTEGLNNILFGFPLSKGDEVILANCDYPYPHNAMKQRQVREGIVPVTIAIGLMNDSQDDIVEKYKSAITEKTKLIHLTYITHREGHILPVKKICDMAHRFGVEVVLDGAHAFGQIEHNVKDLGCDYYATSLHKWLNAPHGTGLLYINKSKISKIHPLASSDEKVHDTMVKFEYLGTRGFSNEIGIGPALDFLEITGIRKKQKHLHKLKKYWVDRVKDLKGVKMHTKTSKKTSCALASVALWKNGKRIRPQVFESEYNVHIKSTGYPGNGFMRVSPNIFTSFEDLDKLIFAFKDLAGKS